MNNILTNTINSLTREHGTGDTKMLIVEIEGHGEFIVQRNDPKLTLPRFAMAFSNSPKYRGKRLIERQTRVFRWSQKVKSWRPYNPDTRRKVAA